MNSVAIIKFGDLKWNSQLDSNSGIYFIRCLLNNKIYIGSATKLISRFLIHRRMLRKKCHPNRHLQNSWNLKNEDDFQFEVIEYVNSENLITREQYYIDINKSCKNENGYNISPTAGSQLGFKFSLEARDRMSAAHRGHKHSKETRDKISSIQKGRRYSDEAKARRKKRILSDQHKLRLSNSLKGHSVSVDTRVKMSISHSKIHNAIPSNNTSGCKGVYYNNNPCATRKWFAQIGVNKKSVHLGSFSTFEEACEARGDAIKKFHGEM